MFLAGGTGVLGRRLVPLLAREGVRVLARPTPRAAAIRRPGVEIVEGDLLDPGLSRLLPHLMEGCSAVLHTATAIPLDQKAPGAWDVTRQLRVDGTRRLLDSALAAGVPRYAQQSIVMAYAHGGDRWLDESAPLDTSPERAAVCEPVLRMEAMVREVDGSRISCSILRAGQFVGPGSAQEELMARLRSGNATVPCDGRNFVSLVHPADMAGAVVLALHSSLGASTFNVCAPPLRYGDYVDRLAGLLGAAAPPRGPGSCPPSWRCRTSRAEEQLGWRARHSIWPGDATWSC